MKNEYGIVELKHNKELFGSTTNYVSSNNKLKD